MSYASFGDDSDVYVYLDVKGYLTCCRCSISTPDPEYSGPRATDEMIDHLQVHRARGDRVPKAALDELDTAAARAEVAQVVE